MTIETGTPNQIVADSSVNQESDLLAALLRSTEGMITGKSWFTHVNTLLEEVGKATKVSRAWVFQTLALQDNHVLQDYVFEWASDKKYTQIGQLHFNYFKSQLNNPEYVSLVESRQKGEYQKVIVSQLPDSWLRQYLENQDVLSMLTIPIIVEGKWWGTLGLDDCEREYDWSPTEITYLRTASYFISSAIIRDNHQAQKNQLEMMKEHLSCSSWEYDLRRGYLWVTSEIFSHHKKSEAPRNLHFRFREWLRKIHPEQRHEFIKTTRQFFQESHSENDTLRMDVKVRREDGSYNWLEVSMNAASDEAWAESTIGGICWDITQRKQQEERLLHEATTDPLTGLINRRKIEEILQHLIDTNQNTSQTCSLAMVDIDHFKLINDNYGHNVGDKVLIHFAEICSRSLRQGDYFARIGGEEFIILLPKVSLDKAHKIYSRLCKTIVNNPYCYNDISIPFSISIGAASVDAKNGNIQNVIERADKALYQAKQSGRNQAVTELMLDKKAEP